jgi:L-threonylcarbamoyladenylate synthase
MNFSGLGTARQGRADRLKDFGSAGNVARDRAHRKQNATSEHSKTGAFRVTLRLDPSQFLQAAELLRAGELVAFPTETVYGLGADATNDHAVASIFAAKNRPSFNPLIVHVPDLAAAEALAALDGEARHLAEVFWPGPMSLVLPFRADAGLSPLVTAGLDTVAIRIPAHPLAQQLLAAAGRPVAAPSANPSGKISPTTAAHVLEGLEGRIAAVLDGGPCGVGLESTIFGGEPVALLRPGGVAREMAEDVLGRQISAGHVGPTPNAPGQLSSHYAPDVGVVLDVAAKGDVPHLGLGAEIATMTLSPSGDLTEAAANLFAMLRQMDEAAKAEGADHFTVAPIPEHGLGLAIRDRLRRAAAPRGSGAAALS